jgi:hypothetical protein
VAGADARTGQYQQTVLGQELPDFLHEREDRVPAAIHDGAAADLHDLQPGQQPDRASTRDGVCEFAVKQGLARERRSDVLDVGGSVGHGYVLSARGDDGADVLAGKRAGQIARDKAIDDLHLANVA